MSGAARVRIHGHSVSTWTRTVQMTCLEKGIAHELVAIVPGSDGPRALHPFRRIPVVEIGDVVVFETLAITGHLDEAFDGPALQPAGLAARTRMRTWMGLCADYLYRDVVRTVPRSRAITAEETATARLALERAEALVGDDAFLAGDEVTLADLYLAPQVANCAEKAPDLLADLPALNAWAARIEARESFRRSR
ncbi:MAG TPA: glutathione S-transferase family protein [Solirubrobacteraceae bacterium]|jgi:glutathione S-transferase|nr:glutathione S-transferase family protein [Solirubrobacteraceae bacterium]